MKVRVESAPSPGDHMPRHRATTRDRPYYATASQAGACMVAKSPGDHKGSPLLCDGFASRGMHGGKGTFLSFHPDISLYVSFASRVKIGGMAHEVYIRKSLFLVHLMHRQLFCIERLWRHPHRKWLHGQFAGYSSCGSRELLRRYCETTGRQPRYGNKHPFQP